MPDPSRFIGIDGSKGAWFAAVLDSTGIGFLREKRLRVLLWPFRQSDIALIDIPIGLPESRGGFRECDRLARERLGPRRRSVFLPLVRPALTAAGDPREVMRLHHEIAGKGIPIQCANIASYMRDADETLRTLSEDAVRPRECHPELAFWSLADARPMQYAKRTKLGIEERLQVLALHAKHPNEFAEAFGRARDDFARKQVAEDDILDALALAALARAGQERLRTLPEFPPADAHGLPMEIVYLPPRSDASPWSRP